MPTPRRTHCKRGHPLTGPNALPGRGTVKRTVVCRECRDERIHRKYMERMYGPTSAKPPNPSGLCFCGCGLLTPIAGANSQRGLVKGEHLRYCRGHGLRNRATTNDYHRTRILTGRPRPEHVAIVEKALGKPLPRGAQVHHVNEDKQDNGHGNLVACEDQSYHRLLHRRRDALLACGNPNWRKCGLCKEWDAPENLYINERSAKHQACLARYTAERRRLRIERMRSEAAA
jgi:hypothetical protein